MRTLKGQVAVITGAGSGIGRSMALALADAGAHVVVADIQRGTAEAVASEVRARGQRSLAHACDVAQAEQVQALADRCFAEFERVDILCNNAGITWRPFRGVADATLDDWRHILGVNLWGVLHGIDAFLPRMRQQPGEKHIVNTASLAGLIPMSGNAPYSSSKAAVVSLSEAMAIELAQDGFGVTVLCPGQVPTNLRANTVLLQGSEPERKFSRVPLTLIKRSAEFALDSVEPVGAMVCQAILDNTLYLHTRAIPSDLLADRIHLQFGPQTVGRTG